MQDWRLESQKGRVGRIVGLAMVTYYRSAFRVVDNKPGKDVISNIPPKAASA